MVATKTFLVRAAAIVAVKDTTLNQTPLPSAAVFKTSTKECRDELQPQVTAARER